LAFSLTSRESVIQSAFTAYSSQAVPSTPGQETEHVKQQPGGNLVALYARIYKSASMADTTLLLCRDVTLV
jgi:hypothetical protein